jgi:Flp pilus assembly protein TadD
VGIACGSIVAEDDLAALLGASSDLKARQLAASHLGRLQSLKPWARAVSRTRAIRLYGGMAFRLARSLGDHHSEGVSLNLQGLGWLAESRWDEAIRCFEEATELLSGLPQDLAVPMIRSTLTYALSLAGDRREARRLLQHEHTPAGDLASSPPIHAAEIATNFAFACLETDDLELAITWGEAALAAAAVATTMGAGDPVDRYAHYAIGEAGARLGDRHRARWHFTAMQRKYYPALSELPDLLLAERTHRFVSWLA